MLLVTALNIFGVVSLRMVQTSSMQGTIDQGSLIVSANWLKPQLGDIAVYHQKNFDGQYVDFVVHRVIAGSAEGGYVFQGDNNISADPLRVASSDVVGVVQFWIPSVSALANPLIDLVLVSLIAFSYFAVKQLRTRPKSFSAWVHGLKPAPRRLVLSALALLSFALILTGLSLTGAARFERPQLGPQLQIGQATDSLVLVLPHSATHAGSLALAQVMQHRSFVRVLSVKGHTVTVDSTSGRLVLPSTDIEGPIVFVLPYLGTVFNPFNL